MSLLFIYFVCLLLQIGQESVDSLQGNMSPWQHMSRCIPTFSCGCSPDIKDPLEEHCVPLAMVVVMWKPKLISHLVPLPPLRLSRCWWRGRWVRHTALISAACSRQIHHTMRSSIRDVFIDALQATFHTGLRYITPLGSLMWTEWIFNSSLDRRDGVCGGLYQPQH